MSFEIFEMGEVEKKKSVYSFRLNDLFRVSVRMRNYFKNIFSKEEMRTDEKFPTLDISSQEDIHRIENPMNNSIVPNEESKSQTENSSDSSKNNPELSIIARAENVIYGLPIFSPHPKKNTKFKPSRTIELGKFTLEDGSVKSKKIKIVPTAEYGYPTTKAQEVWIGLQSLWSQQQDKESGKVEFSRRFFIEKILGRKWGGDSKKAFDLAIAQLGSTRLEFDYVFYDKAEDVTHHEVRKFFLLTEERLTEKKKEDEVIHDKCSVTLHPLIVSNLLSKYYTPINLSVLCSLRKADIAKILYCRLDSHFAYHSSYKISTKRFFYENGIEGEVYKTKSSRKRKLKNAAEKLIGKPTTGGHVIDSFSFEETVDRKDWNLIILRKQDSKAIDSKSKAETSSEADSESLEVKPSPKPEKKNKPVKTQNIAAQEQSSKEITTAGTAAEVFITSFCAKFPNAKPERNSSQKVKKRANEFLEKHGLEQAEDFLVFCLEVGQRQEFSEILKGQTVNYLFDFKAGDQHLIDAWLNDRGSKKTQGEQDTRKARNEKFDKYEDLRRKHRKEYQKTYIKPLYEQLDHEAAVRFSEYTTEVIEERLASYSNEFSREMAKGYFLKSSDDFVKRFINFYKIDLGGTVLTLDQWITQFKSEEESAEYFQAQSEFEAIEAESKAVANS